MKLRRSMCAVLSGAVLFGTTAFAKDNIYAYNKFVSTIIGAQNGYCDFSASFAGHESEFDDVNDYFSGLISAFYSDIDGDYDNELVAVDSRGVTVYQAEDKGVTFLGSVDVDLIANFGNSHAYVFTVPTEVTGNNKEYIGIELRKEVENSYAMYLYDLNPDTDEFKMIFSAKSESNEDGTEQNVWANNKTYYSYTNGGGIQSSINPGNYESWDAAAWEAVRNAANLTSESGTHEEGSFKYDGFKKGTTKTKTHVSATGLRLTDKPVVIFEDDSQLASLAVKPDIVTVTIDGQTLQFPTQDPVIEGEGTTLVPMRTIFEALGADVEWKEEDGVQTIVATTEDKTINMTINSREFFVNGIQRELDVPAKLMNDKTMVPLRAVSESLGCSVIWNQDTKTVIIQSVAELRGGKDDV